MHSYALKGGHSNCDHNYGFGTYGIQVVASWAVSS